MSITAELRKWWVRTFPVMDKELHEEFAAIAHRIDSAHEEALVSSYFDGVFSDEELAENGFVRLPKDADGEPIHVGDRLVPNGMDTDFRVRQMYFNGEWSLDLEGFGISQTCPDVCRHYHKPTVEDVLREFAERYLDYEGVPSAGRRGISEALMDEYAAKLRLADDGEEQ